MPRCSVRNRTDAHPRAAVCCAHAASRRARRLHGRASTAEWPHDFSSPLNRVPDFKPGDTVRLLRASPAHLMTVRAAAPHTVLCASVGPDGKVQYEPYPPEDLELVTPADRRPR